MRVDKVPKGKAKVFAAGGATPMFGKSDRTKSAYPAGSAAPWANERAGCFSEAGPPVGCDADYQGAR